MDLETHLITQALPGTLRASPLKDKFSEDQRCVAKTVDPSSRWLSHLTLFQDLGWAGVWS